MRQEHRKIERGPFLMVSNDPKPIRQVHSIVDSGQKPIRCCCIKQRDEPKRRDTANERAVQLERGAQAIRARIRNNRLLWVSQRRQVVASQLTQWSQSGEREPHARSYQTPTDYILDQIGAVVRLSWSCVSLARL